MAKRRATAAEQVAAIARGGMDALRAAEQLVAAPRGVTSMRLDDVTRRLMRTLAGKLGLRDAGVVAVAVRDLARKNQVE